jgi:hypothetical protein
VGACSGGCRSQHHRVEWPLSLSFPLECEMKLYSSKIGSGVEHFCFRPLGRWISERAHTRDMIHIPFSCIFNQKRHFMIVLSVLAIFVSVCSHGGCWNAMEWAF